MFFKKKMKPLPQREAELSVEIGRNVSAFVEGLSKELNLPLPAITQLLVDTFLVHATSAVVGSSTHSGGVSKAELKRILAARLEAVITVINITELETATKNELKKRSI